MISQFEQTRPRNPKFEQIIIKASKKCKYNMYNNIQITQVIIYASKKMQIQYVQQHTSNHLRIQKMQIQYVHQQTNNFNL